MTSTKTKRLNRSAVSTAPFTPVAITSTNGAKNRFSSSPVPAAIASPASTRTEATHSISALRVSAANTIANRAGHPPTARVGT
jgi:hypothetical protein